MKYRKKPVVIDAVKWMGDINDLKEAFGEPPLPIILSPLPELTIKTLEGDMKCEIGDYIIRGVKGEFYPCKADIFRMTYEEVDTKSTFKTFKDLQFQLIPNRQGKYAKLFFDNGYGVSVVREKSETGYFSYTNNEQEWELAILKGNVDDYDLWDNSPLGHLSDYDVTLKMIEIQELSTCVS